MSMEGAKNALEVASQAENSVTEMTEPENSQVSTTVTSSASQSEDAKLPAETIDTPRNSDTGTNLTASSSKGVDADPPRPVSKQTLLQMQLRTLESFHSRLKTLRSLPAHLIVLHSQSPLLSNSFPNGLGIGLESVVGPDGGINTGADPIASILTGEGSMTKSQGYPGQADSAFRFLKTVSEELKKDATQDALKLARTSEAQDKSGVSLVDRKERKRRRGPAADSPAPYPSFQLQSSNIFPSQHGNSRISNLEELYSYMREVNNRSKTDAALAEDNNGIKLTIWKQSRSKAAVDHVSDPLLVRVAIPDVTTFFVKLTFRSEGAVNNGPVVLSLVAFGPREKKSPHSHSDFSVFQKLTQQVIGMLEKEPTVSFEQVIDLLMAYRGLFITQCSLCGRVLSQEGHVPPVSRLWVENSESSNGGLWTARHISCQM